MTRTTMFWFAALTCCAVSCYGNPISAPVAAALPGLTDPRIVGGVDASIKNYPYQLSMQFYDQHGCGASIISKTWAVTAAHCTGYPLASITVRAGSSTLQSGGTVHTVKRVIVHPKYNTTTEDYDIALLRVNVPFSLGVGVGIISLPCQGQATKTGVNATLTGWGYTTENGFLATTLQVVRAAVTSVEACQTAYGASAITTRMICAGSPAGGVDTCQGDSGGPMVFKNELIGITSWGYGCARPHYPGVYTRVSEVRDWILQKTGV